jgi:hypothetical protein
MLSEERKLLIQHRAFKEALKNYTKAYNKWQNNSNMPTLNNSPNVWNAWYAREARIEAEINRKRAIVRRIGNKIGLRAYRNINPYPRNEEGYKTFQKRFYMRPVVHQWIYLWGLGRIRRRYPAA